MPPSSNQTVPISVHIIRQIFNSEKYYEKVLTGEFQTTVKDNRHLNPSLPPHEPYCTHSQIVIYRDQASRFKALVHQYQRPDGSIGASGKPDPKYLVSNGITYVVKHEPK